MLPNNPEWYEIDALELENSLLKEWTRQSLPFLVLLLDSLEVHLKPKQINKLEELFEFADKKFNIKIEEN